MLAQVYKLVSGGLHMKMDEFLAETGWSSSRVAKFLGISRQAVGRWEEVPSEWVNDLSEELAKVRLAAEVNETFSGLPDKRLGDLSDLELLGYIRVRGSISPDEICVRLSCHYPAFKEAVDNLVAKYPLNGQRWADHPFWGQVKGSCES